MKKKLLTAIFALSACLTGICQDVKEVTLVTSGSAPTEEEATLLALRSAIEQTFGTFVSANTTILNDEIVKDEIVSVSKGNVKNYEKLYANVLPNGQVSVGVKATISISKLISYAKSKGSTAEFAGQTFAMNIKLMELREKNTIAAYKNMCLEAEQLANNGGFNYKIEIGTPKITTINNSRVSISIDTYLNGEQYKKIDIIKEKKEEGYLLPIKISVLASESTAEIYSLIQNTLKSIKLHPKEIEEYKSLGYDMYFYTERRLWNTSWDNYSVQDYYYNDNKIVLPIRDVATIIDCDASLNKSVICSLFNFMLIDPSNPSICFKWHQELINGDHILSDLERKIYSYPKPILYFSDNNGYISSMVLGEEDEYEIIKNDSLKRINVFSGKIEPYNIDGKFINMSKHLHDDSTYRGNDSFFNYRIDNNTNWWAWSLPQNTHSLLSIKRYIKNKQEPKYEYVEHVIFDLSMDLFIPKEQMANFSGFSIEKNDVPLIM